MSTDYSFARFLGDSFSVLRREVPAIHAEMCGRLGARTVRLLVNDEPVAVRFSSKDVQILDEIDTPTIDVQTTRAAILALIDADTTLLDAVLSDTLFLRGSPDALLAFHEGLMAYLHGAFRAPSFRKLLVTFRGKATPRQAHVQGKGVNA